MTNYARTPTQLRKKAVLYWPDELAKKEKAASIMPRLLSTQDKFISILDVSDSSPVAWKHAQGAMLSSRCVLGNSSGLLF